MYFSSFLTLLAVVAATSAGTIEKRKNVDRPDPGNLDHCPGHATNDADKCTFESQSQGPDSVLTTIVGDPVDNCQGGTSDLKTTIGGDKTVSQSWKWGVSEGFSADGGEELPIGASFENSDTWTSTEDKKFSQNVEVTIRPGQKAALVAKVTAKTYLGRVRVNYGDPTGEAGKNDYHFIWYNNGVGSVQPTDQVVYDQKIVNCDQDI
ncbi:hypothetical protein E1B28_003202 [Marasmius oreades]|uniref:Uncharacterized protein n=1 Tax=Marasmius oreades TaxID=181124 RepID=A0A9P7RLY9_9AGAR|nr:uncharacterized protein E1B28_003202 [Marasmius oreades]KAG7085656.1 hypothetical protein E1B28_003202 [Marasmius oreades]